MKPQRRQIALNINFDSMRECLKLVGVTPGSSFRDVAFFEVMERFLSLAKEYGAPLSVFVIGQDLEAPENAAAVREWHGLGHEIGNHSYRHRQDLFLLPADQVRDEVFRAHDVITQVVGTPPKGFISPAWALSEHLTGVLQELDYAYDTSLAPSWLLQLVQVTLWLKSAGARDMIPLVRPDWLGNLSGNRHPFEPDATNYLASVQPARGGLLQLPLPTVPVLRLGLWHTLNFLVGEAAFRRLLQAALWRSHTFYYLMHPADLFDPDRDMAGLPPEILKVERMAVPYRVKVERLRRMFDLLAGQGDFVRMDELAEAARRHLPVPTPQTAT